MSEALHEPAPGVQAVKNISSSTIVRLEEEESIEYSV